MEPEGACPHEIGILILHGIGEQEPAETLLQFGEPIFDWIHSWTFRPPEWWDVDGAREAFAILERMAEPSAVEDGGDAAFDPGAPDRESPFGSNNESFIGARALLTHGSAGSATLRGGEPASATLLMGAVSWEGRFVRRSWLLAESNWARSFNPPPFLEVALWTILIATWLAASVFTRRYLYAKRRARAAASRGLFARAGLWTSCGVHSVGRLLSVPTALLLQAGLLLLMILWTIPATAVRKRIRSLPIVSVVGDILAFTRSPIRRASILDQVSRDLAWLEERCRRVVVVAHSQGAAIAWSLLSRVSAHRVKLLFTFGSGLARLSAIQDLCRQERYWAFMMGVIPTLLVGEIVWVLSGAGTLWQFKRIAALVLNGIGVLFLSLRLGRKGENAGIGRPGSLRVKASTGWTASAPPTPFPQAPCAPPAAMTTTHYRSRSRCPIRGSSSRSTTDTARTVASFLGPSCPASCSA